MAAITTCSFAAQHIHGHAAQQLRTAAYRACSSAGVTHHSTYNARKKSSPMGGSLSVVGKPHEGMIVGKRQYATTTTAGAKAANNITQTSAVDGYKYMVPTYVRPDIVFESGKGAFLYDTEGREYLDFAAGIAVNALGHSDEVCV